MDNDKEKKNGSNDKNNTRQRHLNEHIKVNLRTGLLPTSNIIKYVLPIDQEIEVIASPQTNIQTLKKSIFRQFHGRPPVQSIILIVDGVDNDRILDDNLTMKEIMEEYYEDMIEWNELAGGEGLKLRMMVDIIPPVDPKFGIEYIEKLGDATSQNLIDAYAANWVCLINNARYLIDPSNKYDLGKEKVNRKRKSTIQKLRHEMETFQSIILDTFDDDTKKKLALRSSIRKEHIINQEDDVNWSYRFTIDPDISGDNVLKESLLKYTQKRRNKGGASMFARKKLRKNLIIKKWEETLRTSLLFWFFGYFGGRDSFTRRLMLLGVPMSFLVQTRPFRIIMKRTFYFIVNAPEFFLTLLPVPYQVILGFDYEILMKDKHDSE